jgi:hypothetical protein
MAFTFCQRQFFVAVAKQGSILRADGGDRDAAAEGQKP